MNDELRAAVERVRAVRSNEQHPRDVYFPDYKLRPSTGHQDMARHESAMIKYGEDLNVLIEDFLDEHPADDDCELSRRELIAKVSELQQRLNYVEYLLAMERNG